MQLRLDSSRRKKELDLALSNVLHQILRREGRLDLHAAAVCHPATGDAVLLMGPKGVGKTSLTLALAQAGWPFLTDDSVLVWKSGDALEATTLRVPLYLTADAMRRLPEPHPDGRFVEFMQKYRFDPEALFPGGRRLMARVKAVTFVERDNNAASTSRLERLRAVDCFRRLLEPNRFLAADPSARACLDVARALADLPSFVLYSGPDVLEPSAAARVVVQAFQSLSSVK